MGQAKAKKNKEARFGGEVSLSGRLQTMANETVKAAEYLVENGTATWMIVEMQDGKFWTGLMFKPSIWEFKDNKLLLKQRMNESNETTQDGAGTENRDNSEIPQHGEDTDAPPVGE